MDTSTAFLFGSTIADAIGAIFAGNSAQQEAQFRSTDTLRQSGMQAAFTEQQAIRELDIAKAAESDFRRNQSRIFAERRAAMGASGVRQDTGSPILAAGDFWAETELQASRIREGGRITAERLRQQAALLRSTGRTEASLLSDAGDSARQRGFFRAASSLLSGASAFS